jgi:hypothetical protein
VAVDVLAREVGAKRVTERRGGLWRAPLRPVAELDCHGKPRDGADCGDQLSRLTDVIVDLAANGQKQPFSNHAQGYQPPMEKARNKESGTPQRTRNEPVRDNRYPETTSHVPSLG